jgi:peptidyl-tRNA hydrolase
MVSMLASIEVDLWSSPVRVKEEFNDTKGAIRIRISKNNRQHNGLKKKYKRTNYDLQRYI